MTLLERDLNRAAELKADIERRMAYKYDTYFPDTGPLRRDLYPRSMIFFAGGLVYKERLFLAANRVGKTETAAFEITGHVTGAYKPWWPGKTFAGPTKWWVAGDTRETTRDVPQKALFGEREHLRDGTFSTGMVPAHLIADYTLKPGVADCLDMVYIRHVERHHGAPCISKIQFKSYDQGRRVFQGDTITGGIWLDEEPPDAVEEASGGGEASGAGDIYTECMYRLATTEGLMLSTFTPLRGLTPFVDACLERGHMVDANDAIVNAKYGIFGDRAA